MIIGSSDLKANHAIRQLVDIVSENQKYNKYAPFLSFLYTPIFSRFCDIGYVVVILLIPFFFQDW